MKFKLEDIRKAWHGLRRPKILVIGDVMLDQFTYGDIDRVSPEAPVSILRHSRSEFVPGGAANVALNLKLLKARPILIGVTGQDELAKKLSSICRTLGIRAYLIREVGRLTTLKHRIIARNQHVIRIDHEATVPITRASEKRIFSQVRREMPSCKAVIFSDYAKGIFTRDLVKSVIKVAKARKIPILADFKPINKGLFIGVDLIKPNEKEAMDIAGEQEIEKAGKLLKVRYRADVLLGRGREGMSVFPRNSAKIIHFPAMGGGARDVSGAGDTVIAVAALCKVAGLDIAQSAYLSNLAGGISVQKYGTTPVTYDELLLNASDKYHIDKAYTVEKLWGYEKWLYNSEKYCCKLLVVKKGYQCSLHFHKKKDETFFVIRGHINMELGDEVLHFRAGNYVRIPPNTPHRFRGIEDSEIMESSTNHDENDSYRLEPSRKV